MNCVSFKKFVKVNQLFIILLSINTFSPNTILLISSKIGLTWANLSCPGLPQTGFAEVSATCKFRCMFSYRFLENFISKQEEWKSLSLYQYISWAGTGSISITIWAPKKALISSDVVGYHSKFGFSAMHCVAYAFVLSCNVSIKRFRKDQVKEILFRLFLLHYYWWARIRAGKILYFDRS